LVGQELDLAHAKHANKESKIPGQWWADAQTLTKVDPRWNKNLCSDWLVHIWASSSSTYLSFPYKVFCDNLMHFWWCHNSTCLQCYSNGEQLWCGKFEDACHVGKVKSWPVGGRANLFGGTSCWVGHLNVKIAIWTSIYMEWSWSLNNCGNLSLNKSMYTLNPSNGLCTSIMLPQWQKFMAHIVRHFGWLSSVAAIKWGIIHYQQYTCQQYTCQCFICRHHTIRQEILIVIRTTPVKHIGITQECGKLPQQYWKS
jgi:hypothetical protein